MQSRTLSVLCAAVLMVSAAQAQDSLNVRQVGIFYSGWSPCSEVITVGNNIFCATYGGLIVLAVSNDSLLRKIGDFRAQGPRAHMDIVGNNAYYAISDNGLFILDVSDPTTINQLGFFALMGPINGIAAADNFVYLQSNGALQVIDVADPAAPEIVGFCLTLWSGEIVVSGNHAYITNGQELQVIDISNPTQPAEVGIWQFGGWSSIAQLKVVGDYVYITSDIYALRIVDVSNPAMPIEVGSYGANSSIWNAGLDIEVSDGYIFLIRENNGRDQLQIVNAFDPTSPFMVGQCQVDSSAAFSLSGDYAYISDEYGMNVVNISSPFNPAMVGEYEPLLDIECVARFGNYVYLCDYFGLRLMDISNPAEPDLIDMSSTIYGDEIIIEGNRAYVIQSSWGLNILDISNPTAPVSIGQWNLQGFGLSCIATAGNCAYIAAQNYLHTIDISNPAIPIEVDRCPLSATSRGNDIAIIGNYAYIVCGWTMDIVDISNPVDPVFVGTFQVFGSRIVTNENIAYILHYSRLSIVDLTNPTAPIIASSYTFPPDVAEQIAVEGDYAYVACHNDGLRVIDLSNPYMPVEVGFYNSPDCSHSITVSNHYAYIGGWDTFRIYDCSGILSASDHSAKQPVSFGLRPCYPNPFNPVTTVSYNLPTTTHVQLNVYDLLGRRVAVLTEGMQTAGLHRASFDGSSLASGTYLVRLDAGENSAVQKAVLVK